MEPTEPPRAIPAVAATSLPQSDLKVGIVPRAVRPEAAVKPAPAATPSMGLHQISIEASDISWVLACSDGKKVFEKLFRSGDTAELQFARHALVSAGNARGLKVSFDSRPVVAAGAGSTVRAWKFTPDDYQDVSASRNRTCDPL